MAPPLIVRAVLDAAGYLKVSESVVSSNTAMAETALGMGADFTKSADAQVAAGAKVIASQRAQLTQLKAIQAESVAGSDRRVAADVAVARAQTTLNRSMGITAATTGRASQEAKTAERDFGKLTRGALAGSGVFSKLGRSLAFASSGFIAVAGGATVIAESIRQAEGLAAAQRQVDRQLQTSGKSWSTYGSRIDSALLKEGHLAGFTRTQLLQAFGYLLRVGGNVQRSLNLTGLATDVARGRSISLSAASIALSKALGGSATALRRLGIIVPNNVTKMQALEYVQKKFAGQAEAGTTSSERLGAALSDAGATIGTALLPTFDRLVTRFGNWLHRMTQSGELTRDVNSAVHLLGIGFHTLESAIGAVDKVTGSFGHTLLLIGEIWGGIKIVGWISSLQKVAISWGLVQSAAEKAAAAEAAAASVSAAGIATGDLRAASLAQEGAGGGLLARLGIGGGASGGLSAIGPAIGLAIAGQIAGSLVQSHIHGQAGATTGSALKFAGLGAGIGTLIEPGIGTAVGAGIGGLVGAVASFIHSGPSFNQQAAAMAQSVVHLGTAAQVTAHNILGIRSSIATGRVQRDEAQQTLRQAQAQEKATRGTAAHAAAVDRLSAAQADLKVINDQLSVSQQTLQQQERKHSDQLKQQRRDLGAFTQQLAEVAKQSRLIPGPRGIVVPRSSLMGVESAFDAYIGKLKDLQSSTASPKMKQAIANLIKVAQLFGTIPSSKTARLTVEETLAGTFQLPRVVRSGLGDFPQGPRSVQSGSSGPTRPKGPPPPVVWTGFQLTLSEQIKQVQAGMTKTIADDVKLAKEIIARIKHLIDVGHLVPGTKGYLAALQEQANAESVLQSAEQQKAQQRQAAAQKALELASTYNTPIDLQIAQVQAEMTKSNKDDIAVLKKIIAAAKRVLAQGGKNKQGRLAVLETIRQAQQALQGLLGGGDNNTFQLPLKLQLALARSQALGTDQTKILEKMKRALERALKAAKGNIQKQIDIWNQIAQINSQLGQNVNNAYGDYKKASLKAETANLGLTAAERRALEARLSQIGPGGTTPMAGTGAAGYIIDPDTGRPIHRGHRRQGSQYRGGAGREQPTVNANIDLHVYIDGKQVEAVVTKRQQKSNTRRPTQRRGPNAATR